MAGVVTGLATSDVPGAANWLNQLPPGPNRTVGIKVLVEEIAETDPVAAAEWKNSLK